MIRFIDVLGRTLPKPRVREICQAAELTELEARLLLCRCSDGLSYDQISDLHYITVRQQRVLIPIINNKLQIWTALNSGCLISREINALNHHLSEHNLPLIEHKSDPNQA